MKQGVFFTNLTKKRIETKGFRCIYKKLLPGWELSVVFATSFLMHKLNKQYRKKNKVANVLSFQLHEKNGEIFLNANEKNLLYFFAHGCLHLLSYSHKTIKSAELMENKLQSLLK